MYNIPPRLRTEMCFAARARRVNRVLSALYDERLAGVGLSIGQLDTLVTLMFAQEPLRPIDLARRMQMERSTVSRNLRKLEALGAVEILLGEARRERLVRVTSAGQRLVARAEKGWAEAQDAARQLLQAAGVDALETLSASVAAAART